MKCAICGKEKDSKVLGRHVRNAHMISSLEYAIKYLGHPKEPPLCACGCGEQIKIWGGINNGYNKYIKGHDTRMRGQKTNDKISQTLKRKYRNNEIEPWNKGLSKDDDVRIKKISNHLLGNIVDEETKQKISQTVKTIHQKGGVYDDNWKEKIRNSLLGRQHTDDVKKKISLSKMGENNPMYGKTQSDETKMKRGKSLKDAHKQGKFKGTSCLKNMGLHKNPSRFELAVNDKLKTLGFEFNYPVKIIPRSTGLSYYHIDFAHQQLKIAIELDSELHNWDKTKKSDCKKDLYLKSLGWDIYRIKFTSSSVPNDLAENVFKQAKDIKDAKSKNDKNSRRANRKARGLIY